MSKARETVETLRTVLVDGDVTNANFTGADLEIAKGGTGASSAGAARTALGLVVGTDVLAPDGSAASLTNLPASGAADFVASGTLPNGKPVILKANGQVEVVAESATSIAESIPAGSEVVYNSGTTNGSATAFDPNTPNNFVVVYKDNSSASEGTSVVGTVSGTTISFGTPVVFDSAATNLPSISFDPNTAGKFVVAYTNSLNKGTAIVGTVSGTTVSFGSKVTFESSGSAYNILTFDPNTTGKFVVTYQRQTSPYDGVAIVGTLSGTSTSYGTAVVFNSGTTYPHAISFDPNTATKFVLAFQDGPNDNSGTAIVGTVSGTSVSFGTEVVFNSGTSANMGIAFDPANANKFVVVYQDGSESGGYTNAGTAIVGTVSGTTVSFGTAVVFNSGNTPQNRIAFDPNTATKFVVVYRDIGDSNYGGCRVGAISGTTVSFGTATFFHSATTNDIGLAIDTNSAGKFVVAYKDQGNSNYGTAVLGQIATTIDVTNLTATNFLGTATAAYTNGQTAKIMLQGGISTNQSSLAIGSTYYVQPAGTLTTSAGTPSVVAGKAISATTLLLKGI